MHACVCAYIHTYLHTYIHTCMHACMHACMHTQLHTYTLRAPTEAHDPLPQGGLKEAATEAADAAEAEMDEAVPGSSKGPSCRPGKELTASLPNKHGDGPYPQTQLKPRA